MSFIQSKSFDYQQFAEYLANAEETNQWSNYGWTVKELEKRAREMLKISDDKAIIATSSGTSALHAIVLGIQRNKGVKLRISTENFTFPSSSIGPCEGPIVIDYNEHINANMTDALLVDYGDLIIITNCFGHVQEIDFIVSQATAMNKIVVFDNAATPYSFYKDSNSCNYGTASFISLHHTKPIGFGEGGLAIVDKAFEESIRQAINFGYDEDNRFDERSSNFKMSELSAAGILQWWDQFDIDDMVETYQKNYYDAHYKLSMADLGNPFPNFSDDKFLPFILPWVYNNHVQPKDSYFKKIEAKKYYKPLRFDDVAFPFSNEVYKRILCYPVHGDIVEYE